MKPNGLLLVVKHLRFIEWCFTPLSTVFQSYHGDSSHYSWLSLVSPVRDWGSEVSVLDKGTPKKNPKDPERLEPRTPKLRVKYFTTEHAALLKRLRRK